MGRKKVSMKMIQSKDARQVTFSKRRFSLFKKASELCTLTGAEVASVVFSPGGRPYSFGHPSVDSIRRRFLNHSTMSVSNNQEIHGATASALSKQYTGLCEQVEAVKKQREMLKPLRMEGQLSAWLQAPVDELDLNQLKMCKAFMENLRMKVKQRLDEISAQSFIAAPPSSENFVGPFDLNVPNPTEMEALVLP